VEPEPEIQERKAIHLVCGVINTQAQEPMVNVINTGDDDVTLYPQTILGTCESYYDEFLEDLLERSSVHLQTHERDALKDLLTKYQGLFARSSDDLGRTYRVQHMINTGNAFPIRQGYH
jgi:hypothetical protein